MPSPDGSGKPFEIKLTFFLDKKSDQRKLLFVLGKNNFMKKLETYSRRLLLNKQQLRINNYDPSDSEQAKQLG